MITKPDAVPAYKFTATIDRWVDGDTVWLYVTSDVGFRHTVTVHTDFRLFGINTPEHALGDNATAYCRTAAPAGSTVQIETFKDPDKYGRWLVKITVPGATETLNDTLVSLGLAVPYYGGAK